ncbi:translation elongation factor eEF-1B gamma subunit [Aspergillus heteromorphus CBS 117.55]|uniref:Translation elongation factor eEF-1B gamma subunit n=1 Tax=Aspergillus heteromorphus CBS 117.55 TaxID=1448321 RepID=A0A317WYT2_9EURO|nr:translation elongation factor eEF-1B gamma subunit [Aspergillus heteromorphus CBS 117.55]PWY89888.1 translation elongation factor eEF-1B gamma subunit [Aspergillus heteromorphus CBS 117.55]
MTTIGTIWTYPNNPRVMKTQAAANLNNLKLEYPAFEMRVTNQTPAFLSKFPLGKVPAFEATDGTLLVESDAITQYVAESGPAAAQLLGTAAAERATIRQWICYAEAEILGHLIPLILWRVGFKAYEEAVEKLALEKLGRSLGYLDKHLAGKTWVAGTEKLSLADISVASALVWGFSMVVDAEMRRSYPNVIAWYERTIESDGVREALGPRTTSRRGRRAATRLLTHDCL